MKKIVTFCLLFLTIGLQNLFSQRDTNAPDFYKTNKIQDIKITFDTDKWAYVLDSIRFNGDGYLEGTVEINGQKFEQAGVQYRGNKSFKTGGTKNPFNIKLDYKQGAQHLEGYKTIKLSNSLRDPSLVREVLGYEIAREYMAAPYANYARLTVNGTYYGLMVNIESVEEAAFRFRYFKSANDAFFKANETLDNTDVAGCKNNIYGSLQYDDQPKCYENNFEKISEHGTTELMKLAETLNKNPERIESILHVDATLWMHAFNNVVVNLSSYSGNKSVNFFLYKDSDGRFNPIVWDMNLAFGSYKNTGIGSDLKGKALYSVEPLLHAGNATKPLISQLLSNPDYKKRYLSHVRTILYDYFENGKYLERTKQLQDMIRTDFINDPGKGYTVTEFNQSLLETIGKQSKIPGIEWLMSKRTDFLKKHPDLAVFPSEITGITLARREPMSIKQIDHFNLSVQVGQFPKKVTLMYRLAGQKSFTALAMTSKGEGKYDAMVIPPAGQRTMDYYIVAENAGMLSHSPHNYVWDYHTASLDELNK